MDLPAKPIASTGSAKSKHRVPSRAEAEEAVRTLIAWAGDDPLREGLSDTPARVTRAYRDYFAGYQQNASSVLSKVFKDVGGYNDVVLVRDIPFYSHCEHHLAPFFGQVHIAYLPQDGVIGISKLARLTEVFARRLQTQENMTAQIIDALNDELNPRGAAILVSAEHTCMSMRGVKTPGAVTVTQRFTGMFAEDRELQARFFAMVESGRG